MKHKLGASRRWNGVSITSPNQFRIVWVSSLVDARIVENNQPPRHLYEGTVMYARLIGLPISLAEYNIMILFDLYRAIRNDTNSKGP